MINGMGEDDYSVRLSKTKLLSLEMRRLRSDLIEVFKIMHNLEGVNERTSSSYAPPLAEEVIL